MENDLDSMNRIGGVLNLRGGCVGDFAETASDSLENVESNEGFQTVSAVKEAAASWIGHVNGIGSTIGDIGANIESAAQDFGWTDDDNASGLAHSAENKPLH